MVTILIVAAVLAYGVICGLVGTVIERKHWERILVELDARLTDTVKTITGG